MQRWVIAVPLDTGHRGCPTVGQANDSFVPGTVHSAPGRDRRQSLQSRLQLRGLARFLVMLALTHFDL
jgi:hypothetical protein